MTSIALDDALIGILLMGFGGDASPFGQI